VIVNLLRDQVHTSLGQPLLTFATTETNMMESELRMNSTAIVNQASGSIQIPYSATAGAEYRTWFGLGVLMAPPDVDDTPYRVKLRGYCDRGIAQLVVGNAPAAPDGNNDLILDTISFPLAFEDDRHMLFDDVILIRRDQAGPAPLAFGIAISGEDGGNIRCGFNLSVQNLARTSPKFASHMS
jgi:hypothetical protein